MRTRSRRTLRYQPMALEGLEARALLAANVTAQLMGENLKIVGDNLADRIDITQDTDGNYVVTGDPDIDDGHLTTVNGKPSVTFIPRTPRPITIDARMGDAGEWVSVFGVNAQAIKMTAGDGPNHLSVVDSTIQGAVTLTGGDGGGYTTVYGSSAGAVAIKTGAGDDNVSVDSSTISKGIAIDTGTGNDHAGIAHSSADKLDVTTGGGSVASFVGVDHVDTVRAMSVVVGAGTGFSAATVSSGSAGSVTVSIGTPGIGGVTLGSVTDMQVNGPITVNASSDAWADSNTATRVSVSCYRYANVGQNAISGPIDVAAGPSASSSMDIYQNTATALTVNNAGDASDSLNNNNIAGPIAVSVTGSQGIQSLGNKATSLSLRTGSPGNTDSAYAFSVGDDIDGPITIAVSGGSGSFTSVYQSISTGTVDLGVDGDGAAVYALVDAPAVNMRATGGHNLVAVEGAFTGDVTVTSGGPSSTVEFGQFFGAVSVGGTLSVAMDGGDNTVIIAAPLTATGTIDGGPGVNTLIGVAFVPPAVEVKDFQNVS